MSVGFRPAERSQAKPLIGLYAESGGGKTWSSLLLARGFVGPSGKIGMIETEGGRGELYVGREPVGDYFVRPIRDDFSPQQYGTAIDEANKSQLDALIIDSASHEWEGVNGVLAQASAAQASGTKAILAWQKPKIDHQRHFMGKLLQTPIPLVIVCMRAKYPMEERTKQGGGKEWVRSPVLEPKQSDDILSEMMLHGWLDTEHKLNVSIYRLPEHQAVFPNHEPITIETGQRLAAFTRSLAQAPAPAAAAKSAPTSTRPDPAAELLRGAQDLIRNGGDTNAYRVWFQRLMPQQRKLLDPHHEDLKAKAAANDKPATAA